MIPSDNQKGKGQRKETSYFIPWTRAQRSKMSRIQPTFCTIDIFRSLRKWQKEFAQIDPLKFVLHTVVGNGNFIYIDFAFINAIFYLIRDTVLAVVPSWTYSSWKRVFLETYQLNLSNENTKWYFQITHTK